VRASRAVAIDAVYAVDAVDAKVVGFALLRGNANRVIADGVPPW